MTTRTDAGAPARRIEPRRKTDRAVPASAARRSRRLLLVVAFSGPALIWFAAFMVVPLGRMFYLALVRWPGLIASHHFVGLANFHKMVHDPMVHAAVRNTALQLGVAVPVMIPLAFLLGFFLSRKPFGYRTLSVIFFTPGLVSTSARAMMFVGVYQPAGILNRLLGWIGLGGLQHVWLADNSTALWTIVGVEVWGGVGWTAVLFAAALGAVPDEIYEAARLDGATTWQVIWRFAYPLVRPFFGLMVTLQFLWLLTNPQDVLLLTNGGPGSSSLTLGYMLYNQAFITGHIGYSQAVAVLVFAVGVVGMLVIRRSFTDAMGETKRRRSGRPAGTRHGGTRHGGGPS